MLQTKASILCKQGDCISRTQKGQHGAQIHPPRDYKHALTSGVSLFELRKGAFQSSVTRLSRAGKVTEPCHFSTVIGFTATNKSFPSNCSCSICPHSGEGNPTSVTPIAISDAKSSLAWITVYISQY